MSREYTASINVAAHTAQLDVFELLAGTGKPLEITEIHLAYTSEVGEAQEEWIVLALKRVTGAPTSGTSGSTSTPQPISPNDAASAVTLETGNTGKLTGGTSVELARVAVQVRAGEVIVPVPEARWKIDAATRLVLEEVVTPTDSITGPVGWISFIELI